ncbi:hypothetical protein JCM8547_004001 [Rhodosporidiobolus lusitaniae]
MPRGLSKAARATLVEAQLAEYIWAKTGWERYTEKEVDQALASLQSPGQPLYQPKPRVSGGGPGIGEARRNTLRQAYHNRLQLGFPAGGGALYDALAKHINSAFPHEHPPCTAGQLKNGLDYMRRNHQLELNQEHAPSPGSPAPAPASQHSSPRIVLHHQGMMFSGRDHVLVPNDQVTYDERHDRYHDSHGETVTPHWPDLGYF